MKGKKIVSTLLALLLLASLPMSARAAEYDIGNGDITVNAGSGGQTVTQGSQVDIPDSAPVITGSSTENIVTIHAEKDQTANVTLSDVNIDVGVKQGKAAVSTTGDGNVSIELNGDNKLRSGQDRAGLEKNNGGSLTIADEDKPGKLTAEGGLGGAGIGGGDHGNGDDIAITGGEVEATGGYGSAGIGGGNGGAGKYIKITGGKVDAKGGTEGAGIGGGNKGEGKDITISGGEVTATGGDYGAGIGGGLEGDGSDIAITGGEVTATGGDHGAGIGGGWKGTGSDITISGDKVDAKGGKAGAGIGGGIEGTGSGITITGGEIKATGGDYGAGIGGGNKGEGKDITITGGEVTATGGEDGAGIGGGRKGTGSDITITGGEIKATGGDYGAGIGGGRKGTGSDITITSGEIKATGGDCGAGIGGGLEGDGNNITVSGDAQLKVQGGVKDGFDGAGAGIGDGGSSANGSPIPGAEVAPDTSGLTTGRIEYYAPGADMEKDKPTSTFPPQEKPTEPGKPTKLAVPTKLSVPEQPEAERSMDAPLYFVTGRDGRAVRCRAERKDGVLTVTVDEDFAVLTVSLSGMTALRAQGVEKIIFVTNGAKNTVKLSTIISRLTANGLLRLTHYGKAVTFTIDGWRLLRYCHCQFASTEQFRQPLPKLRCQPLPFPYILRKIGKSIIL